MHVFQRFSRCPFEQRFDTDVNSLVQEEDDPSMLLAVPSGSCKELIFFAEMIPHFLSKFHYSIYLRLVSGFSMFMNVFTDRTEITE